ncbi:30S ribosomal protein S2 [Mycoplasma sp. CSL10137]|uniref:30S ribosomal protein S2 n=1 Tax=unclassified Mycoplasma TaxID=2683645 RepID=UPI00197B0B99|nr:MULTISPECIES: 30S ribosomal protein S2 [unclassified Mycoplasma]MBN4083502.1 30S ribosomal protein S2 [Mycoplasma sp. CSL10137]MBU4693045.1 30S ribosomal protein S2 [Mycoplasma sp. CSL7491-lung]
MTENKKVENNTKETKETKETKLPIVSRTKLLEAGAYFGHKTYAWNPKMKEFLVPNRKNRGAHIIDIFKTQKYLEFAYSLVSSLAAKNAQFIFVGTKKQAKDAIKAAAERTNSLYVTERWLGGTLTNNETIMKRVQKMEELEAKAADNFKGYTKKEALNFTKELEKLHKNLNGIRSMKRLPNVMIVADPIQDEIAVKEAKRKGLKVISLLDSNANPDLVDFGIPANDDSAKSITLIITVLADAIAKVKGGQQLFAYQDDEKVVLPEFQPKNTSNNEVKESKKQEENN